MNKKILVLVLSVFFITSGLTAETVLVAPVSVYDRENKAVEMSENPSKKIMENLSRYWFEGLVSFKELPFKKYGMVYTALDANRICNAEEADFILFGYIQKNENSWQADIKFFDRNTKKIVKEFFCADDIFHYERMMENLCSNILGGLEEVTDLNRSEIIKETQRPFELKLPVSAFYWSPVDGKWNGRITGIAGGSLGVEIFPPHKEMVYKSMLFDFSLRPEFSYSYGMGKDGAYSLNYSTISFVLPVLLHMNINLRNKVYFGFGPYYEFELLQIRPKYEDEKFMYQNMFGLESVLGYEFKASDLINIFTEVRFDFHFNGDRYFAVKPVLGMSFNLFREEL